MPYYKGCLSFALILLLGVLFINAQASLSYIGRCGKSYNGNKPCRCHCADTTVNQKATCDTVAEASTEMWRHDINRLPDTAFDLNYQGHVPFGSTKDRAAKNLFTRVDESQIKKPTFQTYIRMLDNYDPVKGATETVTSEEAIEINEFLDEALKTKVMDILLDYLKCSGIIQNQSDLRNLLYKLWFKGYPRSGKSNNLDTSGFEHVMVGEFKSTSTVNGFHSWVSFYLKEKVGDLNYRGYVSLGDPHLVGAAFIWHGRNKAKGSFAVRTSPEFDLAIFTLCFLSEGPCIINLAGKYVSIRTYNTNGQVATAFVEV